MKVLHSICQQIWKTQQWPQDWKWSVFIPIPKKGNAKECSNYCTTALIAHASKGMLKVLQAMLNITWTVTFQMFKLDLEKAGEGNGNPLQCSCLENPRDGGAWWAASLGSHRVGHDWSDLAAAAEVILFPFFWVSLWKRKPKTSKLAILTNGFIWSA